MRYWMTATSIVALASAAMLALLLFSRVQRYARSIEGQTALRSEKQLLEQRVQERTAELEHERRIAERERQRVELAAGHPPSHRQFIGHRFIPAWPSDAADAARMLARLSQPLAIASRRVSTAHRRCVCEDMESARVDDFLGTVINDIRTAIGQDRKIEFSGPISRRLI